MTKNKAFKDLEYQTGNTLPDPVIVNHDGFQVVRDDLLPGGTKRRALSSLLSQWDNPEFVYASTAHGYGPVALAYACRDIGRKATLVYSWRKNDTPLFAEAKNAGANIVMTPKRAFFVVVHKKAREYAAEHPDAKLLNMGFNYPEYVEATAEIIKKTARYLSQKPREIWCAGGSGTLTRALQMVWPDADHHVIRVSKVKGDFGAAAQHFAPETFEQKAKQPPPFPSAKNYDAKIWQFVTTQASPGALVWNVGG